MATLTPKCKVWFEREGSVALSDWRVDLLLAVDRCGSLAAAARQLDVPYKTAWYKLKEVEAGLGMPVLQTTSGGRDHGSAVLTPVGKQIVERYQAVVRGLQELVDARFAAEILPLLEPAAR